MKILGIDASGKILSLSLRCDGIEKGSSNQKNENIELLSSFLSNFLDELSIKTEQIDVISLIRGPGSYTGLRGSLLVARSWALLKGIQVMTRLWHEVVMYSCRQQEQPVLASMAVRQNEYYFAAGQFQAGEISYLREPQLVSAEKLITEYESLLCPVIGDWPESTEKPEKLLSAGSLSGPLAEWTEFQFQPDPLDSLVPFYVRPAVRPVSAANAEAKQS